MPKSVIRRLPAPVNHHVGGFEVAVQNTRLVNGVKSGAELSGDLKRFVGRKSADATQQRRQIVAVDKLH